VSDYETTQRKRNIVVGVFVVAGMCALVWLIFKFGDLPRAVTKVGSFDVFVQFPTAPGVQRDTPVRFCGFQIGRVTKVMAPEVRPEIRNGNETGLKYHQTLVVLSIDKKYVNIPYNSEVKLMTRGLGSSYIEIKAPLPEPNKPVTKFLGNGSLLQGSTGMTSEFFPEESQKKLDELVEDLKTLLSNANDIIGGRENKENIKKTLANLAEMTQQATQTIEEFQKLAAAGTSTLKNADAKVEKVVTTMVDASEELSKATSQLRIILEKINSGQGTAARLVNDGRFYESLLENTQQLQVLLEDLTSFIAEVDEKGLRSKW
jgi:ABC-type transporter Mla subunit MlaD